MTYQAFLETIHDDPPQALLDDVREDSKRYYHDPKGMIEWAREQGIKWFCAGRYLGEDKKTFRPSPYAIIRSSKHAKNKTILDEKGAWLFLCERDAFGRAIKQGTPKRKQLTIVYDEEKDVLGVGEWLVENITTREKNKPVLKHKHDIGAYLRGR